MSEEAPAPTAFNTDVGGLISNVILAIGTGYGIQQLGGFPKEFRSIHASIGILFLNAAIGIVAWFAGNDDVSNVYWFTYLIRLLLYLAGFNSELYLRAGYDQWIAYIHFVPAILVPLLNLISNFNTSSIIEVCIIGNLLSSFYITYTTENRNGMYTAGIALLSTIFHWLLTLLDMQNIDILTFREAEFQNLIMTLFSYFAVRS